MTSLEALLLETQHSLESAAEGGNGDVQEVELKGVAKLTSWHLVVLATFRGCFMVVCLAPGSGSRRLARLSGCQFGVAQCLKAALAATAMWDNLACSGLRRVAQLCCSHSGVVHRRKMAQATTLVCCHDGGSYVRVQCNELLLTDGARFGSLMEIWETGQHCSSFRQQFYRRIRDMEY